MKKSTLLLSAAAILGAVVFVSCNQNAEGTAAESRVTESAAKQGSIVYVNMDRILQEYDMANDLSSALSAKQQGIEQDLNRRGSKIERDGKEFQDKVNKGLMTQSTAEIQYNKLQNDQAVFQNYYAQKSQEMQEEAYVTNNKIMDAIGQFLKKYNEEKGYAMILVTSGELLSIPVACADSTLNITDDVVAGLNKEYVTSKNQQ